jgi:hypothetical protein
MLVQLPISGDWIRAEDVRSIRTGSRARVMVMRKGEYSYEGNTTVVKCLNQEDAVAMRDEIASIVKQALGERSVRLVA